MPVFALRSSDFDERSRVEEFRGAVAAMCQLDILPEDRGAFRSETVIGLLPDVVLGATVHSACVTERTAALAADTGDSILFHIPVDGAFSIRQRGGEEVVCQAGEVYVDPSEVPGISRFAGDRTEVFYVSIPRALVGVSAPGLDRVQRGKVTMTPQWRMFARYAASLQAEMAMLSPREIAQCATQLQDLAIMALGAGRDACEIAEGRGVRAERLRALKADIETHLTSPQLTIGWLAARHRLSDRYIRALFAGEGTSFRDHVTGRRLMLARRALSDHSQSGRSISDIAMAAGFGDLSWFNACFRKTFGMTPSQLRATAKETALQEGAWRR